MVKIDGSVAGDERERENGEKIRFKGMEITHSDKDNMNTFIHIKGYIKLYLCRIVIIRRSCNSHYDSITVKGLSEILQ